MNHLECLSCKKVNEREESFYDLILQVILRTFLKRRNDFFLNGIFFGTIFNRLLFILKEKRIV